MSAVIERVHAREVLDSRGTPTVEAEVRVTGGHIGRAIVPAGASTGKYEAWELRDRDDPIRYEGKGVRTAVAHVRDIIAPTLVGMAVEDQEAIDKTMITLDGTPNKQRLGANAMLGVSLACAHAAAASQGMPLWRYVDAGRARLPMPMVNLISGGLHAGGNLDFQDFLFLPCGATTYSEALEWTVRVYNALGRVLTRRGYEGRLVGDEGGFGPRLKSLEEALDLCLEAIHQAGLAVGSQAGLALDVAATHFWRDDKYHLRTGGARTLDSEGMIDLLTLWCDRYPILSIEDGLAEDDWVGWRKLTAALGERVQLIGDDLFVTHPERVRRGIRLQAANAVLVKPNQIGTLSETLEVMRLAREAGFRTVLSARSGETEDTTLADLAVGTGAGQIKIGSVVRSERLAKYNALLRIEEAMGSMPPFAGWR
jgi:enolase